MNTEIYKQLDFLRNECLTNFRERSITFTEESVESMYNNTKDIITELLEVRHSQPLSISIIKKHMSQNDTMEWQQIEVWLFQLTDMDDSFIYAYNHLAQKFNRENGCAMYRLKEVSQNKLRILLENSSTDNHDHLQMQENKVVIGRDKRISLTFTKPDQIYAMLEKYFENNQKDDLYKLIKNSQKPLRKLFFQDSGNRLTEAFKKLKENDFIIGIYKSELENWIVENFTFLKGEECEFNIQTVAKYISRKSNICKSPIFEITNGEIKRSNIPKVRKDNNQ